MGKLILFDLDGTLLPMVQEEFTGGYLGLLTKKAAPYGYEPKTLVDAIWKGTAAMVANDGSCTNETAFWRTFAGIFGQEALRDKPIFEEFYREEFQEARKFCGFNPEAAKTVRALKEMGFQTALATNPFFPAAATESRIRWAGLQPEDFALYTTYENIGYCKPNLNYFTEVLSRLQTRPEDALMVGDDIREDMAARQLGMDVFLLTDCVTNREDISAYPHGSFPELMDYIRAGQGAKR